MFFDVPPLVGDPARCDDGVPHEAVVDLAAEDIGNVTLLDEKIWKFTFHNHEIIYYNYIVNICYKYDLYVVIATSTTSV